MPTEMNFEAPLTSLVWITSIVSIALTYVVSYLIDSDLGGNTHALVEAGVDHFLRHAGRRGHSGTGESVYLDRSRHVQEVVTSAERRRRSLNILSGFVAGNFSAYWLGISIVALDGASRIIISTMGLALSMARYDAWRRPVFGSVWSLSVSSAWDR